MGGRATERRRRLGPGASQHQQGWLPRMQGGVGGICSGAADTQRAGSLREGGGSTRPAMASPSSTTHWTRWKWPRARSVFRRAARCAALRPPPRAALNERSVICTVVAQCCQAAWRAARQAAARLPRSAAASRRSAMSASTSAGRVPRLGSWLPWPAGGLAGSASGSGLAGGSAAAGATAPEGSAAAAVPRRWRRSPRRRCSSMPARCAGWSISSQLLLAALPRVPCSRTLGRLKRARSPGPRLAGRMRPLERQRHADAKRRVTAARRQGDSGRGAGERHASTRSGTVYTGCCGNH